MELCEMKDTFRKILTQFSVEEVLSTMRLAVSEQLNEVRRDKDNWLPQMGSAVWRQLIEAERKLVPVDRQMADLHGYFVHQYFTQYGLDAPARSAPQQLSLGF